MRFRANFYVQWATDEPFFEDSLVGRELRIGETVTIQIVKKDGRCVMITLDPDTASRSPVVLEKVARDHDGMRRSVRRGAPRRNRAKRTIRYIWRR